MDQPEQEKEEQAGVAGEKENDRNKNKRNNINAIIRSAKRLEQRIKTLTNNLFSRIAIGK